ncbi:hypothetical protein DOTSEDRAFT_49940 [Dothistroma septosporum NZE10]|uniref:Uncharacterized protein n=1 Tax=Dothistroma septosporum (strain NZE10 / CBS 128990) TaxID=675120 RepID=N1Q1V7_DOTSN|nr:hypothetical protein DOTSEDRAFT_49940 [Dothistroma septosporum NZE10]
MRYVLDDGLLIPMATPDSGSYQIKNSTRQVHLHDLLRAGARLVPIHRKAIESFEQVRDKIDQALTQGSEYPWYSLGNYLPPDGVRPRRIPPRYTRRPTRM